MPDREITRAEALKMLLVTVGAEIDMDTTTPPFDDVSSEAWYLPYIAYAKENNIVNGYSDGSFAPNASLTRAEAAKLIAMTFGL